jgi:hypothetical protein
MSSRRGRTCDRDRPGRSWWRVAAAHTRQGSHYVLGRQIPLRCDNSAVLKSLWRSLVGLLREPHPSPDELAERLEVEAELQRAKDKWLADEARQARQSGGTGPGI